VLKICCSCASSLEEKVIGFSEHFSTLSTIGAPATKRGVENAG